MHFLSTMSTKRNSLSRPIESLRRLFQRPKDIDNIAKGKDLEYSSDEQSTIAPTTAEYEESSNFESKPSLVPEPAAPPPPPVVYNQSFHKDHFIMKNPHLPAYVTDQLASSSVATIRGPEVAELTAIAQQAWHAGVWPDGTPADMERRWSGGERGDGIGGGCG
jgi:hypothetical protein